jgi:putative DNA primase/helicase
MEAQGGVLSLISDEGGIIETFAGRYNGGITNIDLANKAHAGSPFRCARGSRDDIDMPQPTLTMSLSPQPGIIRGLIKKPVLRETGFLARFLYVVPVSQLGHRTLEPVGLSHMVSNAYEAALHNLLKIDPPQGSDGNPTRYRLKLSGKAHSEWKEYALAVEHDLLDGQRFESLKDWGGKLPGAAVRVAGLLHCAEHTTDGPQNHLISKATMETALEIMVVLEEHAIAAFELMKANPDVEDGKKILKWIQRNGKRVFSQRDCHNRLQGSFQRVGDLEPGLSVLVERSFIRALSRESNRPGRPSVKYEVHPSFEVEKG